jgi:hypothetical protein
MRRGYNPHRVTMTERLAFNLCGDSKKKVRAIRQQNTGLLPWQRQLIVTTFVGKSDDKPIVKKIAAKIEIGSEVIHSAGGVGIVKAIGKFGLRVSFDSNHSDSVYPKDQICQSCRMVFPTGAIRELHSSQGHRKAYPYVGALNQIMRKRSESEEVWERQTAVQYDKDDNRTFVQTIE